MVEEPGTDETVLGTVLEVGNGVDKLIVGLGPAVVGTSGFEVVPTLATGVADRVVPVLKIVEVVTDAPVSLDVEGVGFGPAVVVAIGLLLHKSLNGNPNRKQMCSSRDTI